jgi:hypothetical protein
MGRKKAIFNEPGFLGKQILFWWRFQAQLKKVIITG